MAGDWWLVVGGWWLVVGGWAGSCGRERERVDCAAVVVGWAWAEQSNRRSGATTNGIWPTAKSSACSLRLIACGLESEASANRRREPTPRHQPRLDAAVH